MVVADIKKITVYICLYVCNIQLTGNQFTSLNATVFDKLANLTTLYVRYTHIHMVMF